MTRTAQLMTRACADCGCAARCSHVGRWPDFLIIGAMKAGTTTLFGHLAQHPGIFMCHPKEPQFFSRDEIYERGTNWYRNLFTPAVREQLCGEASTCYSRWPHHDNVPERIAEVMPNVRLIYMMRHPVERCYSHYGHRMQERARRGMAVLSFDEYLGSDPEAIDASLYMQQIERYLTFFSRDQCLFLIFEDFVADPQSNVNAVLRFLGLPAPQEPVCNGSPINARGSKMARTRARRMMHAMRNAWGLRHIADYLPVHARRRARERCEALISGSVFGSAVLHRFKRSLSPLTYAARAELLHRFAKPNRELERFLGRSLNHWRA